MPTAAAQDPLIPRQVLFGNPERAAVRISPDGERLAWLAPKDGVLNVFVAPIDALDQAKAVTHDQKRGIRIYEWAFDGRHLLYMQDADGDENYHVYKVDLETGANADLTPFAGARAQIIGLSPDKPAEALVSHNDRNKQLFDVYRVDLASGQLTLVAQNDAGFIGYVADRQLGVRFAQIFAPDGGIAYFPVTGDTVAEQPFLVVPQADTLTTAIAGFDQSGQSVYLLDSRDRDTAAFYTMNLASGEKTLVGEDPRADVEDIIAHPVTGAVQGWASNYTRQEWRFTDPAVKADYETLKGVARGEIQITSRTLDDKTWTVAFSPDDASVKYYLFDREAKKATFLFDQRPELEGQPLARMYPVVIDARDGLKLVSYYTLPRAIDDGGKAKAPAPMVLMVHGGPWARDAWGYDPYHQWLANRGYVVLSVNFRGSTGFGKGFVNAGDREWAGKMHDDLLDAVKWAVEQKLTTESQVAIMGGSYGGYATLVGLTFTPETFACGVDIVGPSNIATLLSTIPPYWAPMVELFRKRVGDHSTDEGKAFLDSRSPLGRVDAIKKPLLIGQGANDPRVKQSESDQIVQAMQAKNIPVTYVLFPDEGHGFARPENRLAFNAVTEAFLKECLGGRVEAFGGAFEGSTIQVPAGAGFVSGLEGALPAAPAAPAAPEAPAPAGG
ncbi:MAG: S9 family peptidase [Myxococcales bacterium]|nr:S9 family peptidase [Myxococcales bacterium]MCB9543981.1 S9 family peptidase [Myxococcales bacterium]